MDDERNGNWKERKFDNLLAKLVQKDKRIRELEEALLCILDATDYTAGYCKVNEPVGGVLPKILIENARTALSDKSNQSDKCGNACGYVEPYGFVPESGCPVHCPEDKEE